MQQQTPPHEAGSQLPRPQAQWAAAPEPARLPHEDIGGSPGLADQLLVAQLHALQLGSAALPAGPQVAAYMPVAVRSAADPAATSAAANSPHQLDAALLGGGDLFARLQMGAAGPMLPVGAHGLMALQSAGMGAMAQQHAAAHLAAGAAMQQQQQQRQPPVPGRRRSTGGRRNEEKVRRTVYISDISEAVSEAQLAGFFVDCGQLVDCRVCGDPNSSMRFAFIEFMSEEAAQQALSKSGALLGDFPIRVSPSKTAIVPVNNNYLPRSTEERELVARTVFVGNIDRVVEREQLREFFDNLCGTVSRIRLLGDTQHSSKIAFVEFVTADSARNALKLSGALLGTLPLRVSPSKTPVRVDSWRSHDVQQPRLPAMQAMPPAVHHHSQLNPALLMAVAGFSVPSYQSGGYNQS